MQLGSSVNAARCFDGVVVLYQLRFVQSSLKKKSEKQREKLLQRLSLSTWRLHILIPSSAKQDWHKHSERTADSAKYRCSSTTVTSMLGHHQLEEIGTAQDSEESVISSRPTNLQQSQ